VAELSSATVWQQLQRASFAVVSYVTPAGEPRSSGVVYAITGSRMYIAMREDSWKARHIAVARGASVTVLVRRGGVLSLLLPIPPATVSFHAKAAVYPASALAEKLSKILPPGRRDTASVIELCPMGYFVTYAIGVPLAQMRHPDLACGRRARGRRWRPERGRPSRRGGQRLLNAALPAGDRS
jgi:hypothetical protein